VSYAIKVSPAKSPEYFLQDGLTKMPTRFPSRAAAICAIADLGDWDKKSAPMKAVPYPESKF